MTHESNGIFIIDEIDRLFVIYGKAKEYINKISANIDQQIDSWQYRRQIIFDQMNSTSSFDFLLPKTQRINELTIEAVQALCRVELLMEQVLRVDPRSSVQTPSVPKLTSFSTRSFDNNVSRTTANTVHSSLRHPVSSPSLNSINQQQLPYTESIASGKILGKQILPVPVLRTAQTTPTNRLSLAATHEKAGFKPIEQHRSSTIANTTPRPTPIHPQTAHYPATEGLHFISSAPQTYHIRSPQSEHVTTSPMVAASASQMTSNYPQPPRGKAQVKLQRIPPGTRWPQAKIDVIDSLSAFYVENYDPKVRENFERMLEGLHNYYSSLEQSNKLMHLENICIGDFGVAKYNGDGRWYRARVVKSEENDRIQIVFIDFGNIEIKDIHDFFPLDKLYTYLPAQAIACTLSEAFPRTPNDNDLLWPQDTIQIFTEAVTNSIVEVTFSKPEEGTEQWPLHFVIITVGNQTVTNLLNLKQRIEPKANRYIAEKLANSLNEQEYILFNVPIDDSDFN
ncbi:unnamed protein product [Rotaria magnacalcarata]|uniref:Tudor domain-containing protein n=5 Tax=Rotaria magnacalcarata TaxID=392030 RepID=A0A817AQ06_9BILA|nr:unnamed protein product [Rotaria magnacalcarata]CAF3757005.1 unnamed protein product [Rotaria magnacalcarata]